MDRRRFVGASVVASLGGRSAVAQPAPGPAISRAFGRSGERIPAIGMGSWLTFDIGGAPAEMAQRQRVLQVFFDAGGGVIDSSPMYGRAEKVVGDLLPRVRGAAAGDGKLFAATKVWTPFDASGRRQHADSLALWGRAHLDLQQVHNLLNTDGHLKMLRAARERGEVRYLGATTSHGRRHDEMLALMRREPLDAIQITYNLADPSAEALIDEAAARGLAVLVNRPFDGGVLPDRLAGKPLPDWAREIDCAHWPAFLLKWILGHPGVSCAIPATTNPVHMAQNMEAGRGRLPDPAMRRRMQALVRDWL